MWFDTHAHLWDARFAQDRAALIAQLPSRGIDLLVNVVEYHDDHAEQAVAAACCVPYIYAALGVHPHEAQHFTPQSADGIARIMRKHPKVVALGEIGLDYHYDFSPRAQQRAAFAAQVALAQQVHKPIIVHMREATADTLDILESFGANLPPGVMHCYSGSYETARRLLDRGWYVSFSGSVTFKNAAKLADVARRIPLDRVLVETDCPYLAPVPMRGKRNQPDFVQYTGAFVAALHNMPVAAFAAQARGNGCRLFGIDPA
nr:TatD family hydrolase [Maliibacterium massiliense]